MSWSVSESFLYGGIAAMAAAAVITMAGILIFTFTGQRLKKKLEEEYGKPRRE
ncbi:MAG: hypothetical protein NC121_20620 [Blautia sp.]|nr:hypothetical protein [Blautia sp.]